MPKTVEEIQKELADAIVARDGGITNANAKELLELGKKPGVVPMVKKEIVLMKEGKPTGETVEIEVPLEGNVESVSIAATINLGAYSNTKLEVSASNGPYARYIFEQEIQPTIDLVKSVIKKVNAKG
jgi:hypothetical protein